MRHEEIDEAHRAAEAQERAYLDAITDAATIIPEAIHEEYARLPVDLATWNSKYAATYRRALLAKRNLEHTRAIVYLSTRERLRALDGKVTEAMIAAEVERDERVENAAAAEIEAQVARVRAFGELDALRAKRDMLQSLGAGMRAEWAAIAGRAPQPPRSGG